MKQLLRISAISAVLFAIFIADFPVLPAEMVPSADAIMGVRRRTARRTAVIVGSEVRAEDSAQIAQAQQQAAAANQKAAAAEQQAGTASAPIIPIGTVVQALPGGCTAVTVSGKQYSDCGGVFYEAAYQGNKLVYVVVEKPLK